MTKQNTDTWSVFDIIGPVMIGPSSSHTAGACKLGYMAQKIFGQPIKHAHIYLHGSFSEVYHGHFTDTAILGGLLGFIPSKTDIIQAKELCQQAGLTYTLEPTDLGAEYHPNTVRFVLSNENLRMTITGSSVGGGKVIIEEIDKIPVYLNNNYSSLLVCYDHRQFPLTDFLAFLGQKKIPVRRTKTHEYKDQAILDIEIEDTFADPILAEIETQFDVHWVRSLNHLSHYLY